jgi:hypothetical protein
LNWLTTNGNINDAKLAEAVIQKKAFLTNSLIMCKTIRSKTDLSAEVEETAQPTRNVHPQTAMFQGRPSAVWAQVHSACQPQLQS